MPPLRPQGRSLFVSRSDAFQDGAGWSERDKGQRSYCAAGMCVNGIVPVSCRNPSRSLAVLDCIGQSIDLLLQLNDLLVSLDVDLVFEVGANAVAFALLVLADEDK